MSPVFLSVLGIALLTFIDTLARLNPNPPGTSITSVLVVRDNDTSSEDDVGTTTTAVSAATGDDGPFGRVLNMLDALPTHVLEAARQRRPHSASGATASYPGAAPSSLFVGKPVPAMSTIQANPAASQVSGMYSELPFQQPLQSPIQLLTQIVQHLINLPRQSSQSLCQGHPTQSSRWWMTRR